MALVAAAPSAADDRAADPRPAERGLPAVTSFPSNEIGAPQLFGLVTAGRRLYVATLAGVAIYDGAHWSLAESARALYALHAAHDRVIAGGPDVLVEVVRGADGRYTLSSLLEALPPDRRAIGDVRSIHALGEAFFAVTDRALVRIAGREVRVLEQWRSDPARRGFVSRGCLYVVSQAALRAYSPQGEPVADGLSGRDARISRLSFLVDHPAAGPLVGVEGEGVFAVADDGTWRAAGRGAGDRLRHRLTEARVLADGSVAILAAGVGVLRLAPDLAFDGVLSHAEGLPPGPLVGLAVDDEGGLWAAGESSLARVDLGAGLTRIDGRLGLDGTVNAVVRHDDRLHVLTTTGLFSLEHPAGSRLRAVRIPGVTGRTWAAVDGGDHLLVAGAEGVFEHRPGGVRRVPGTARLSAYALAPVTGDSQRMLVGSRAGLAVLVRDGAGWRFERHVPGAPRYVRTIVSRPGGVVFVGTSFDGVVRVSLADDTATTICQGETTLREVDGAILVLSTDVPSLAMLDEHGGVLRPLPRPPVAVPPHTVRFAVHPSGALWMTGRGAVVDAAGVGPRPVLDRSLTIQALHIEDDGVVWLGGSSGLWRLPYGARRAAPPPAPTLEHVFVNGRPIAKDGASGAVLRLPHGIERLRVQFSPNTFSSAVVTDFRLEPLDAQWNTSGRGQAAEYTSLPEGAYRLRIRSTHGTEQAETTWAFQVRPPWYRTAWAYAAEAMSGVAALLLLSHWRTRRLRRRSEELERAVIEQTAALQAANERLAALAWRDELTGLHNRRHFDSVLAAEWARARRAATPIALVLVDLDHFKRLNDSLGHVAGDRALRSVAAVIERCARGPGDVAARYGGDEFAVLLPGGRWERAHALAEEIREAVAALAAPHPGHPLGLMTVSVGVTAVPAPEGPEPTLVDAADRALYRAKAAGRNAVAA